MHVWFIQEFLFCNSLGRGIFQVAIFFLAWSIFFTQQKEGGPTPSACFDPMAFAHADIQT